MNHHTPRGHSVEPMPTLVEGYVVAVYDRDSLVGYAAFSGRDDFTIDPYRHEQFDHESASDLADVLTAELADTWNRNAPGRYAARAEPFGKKIVQ